MSLCVFREKKRRSQEGCIVLTPLVVSTLGLAAPISSEPYQHGATNVGFSNFCPA